MVWKTSFDFEFLPPLRGTFLCSVNDSVIWWFLITALHPALAVCFKRQIKEKGRLPTEPCPILFMSLHDTYWWERKCTCPHISISKKNSKKHSNKWNLRTTLGLAVIIYHHFNCQLSSSSITTAANKSDISVTVHWNDDITASTFNHISNEGNASWFCQFHVNAITRSCKTGSDRRSVRCVATHICVEVTMHSFM